MIDTSSRHAHHAEMANPLVLDYLRTHSLVDLFAEHGVRASVSPAHPYKASFNYDQIAARNDDPLAAQCRGLVLTTADATPFPTTTPPGEVFVLARPMDRFFNLGHGPDGSADVVDADLSHPDARVYEKLDGTLCILYYDPFLLVRPAAKMGCLESQAVYGDWCVATRSVPDADRVIDGFGDHTFRSLFEQAIDNNAARSMIAGQVPEGVPRTFGEFTRPLDQRLTYCFELTSPRAGSGVVSYDEDEIWLLAVRERDTGREVPPETVNGIGICVAPHHAVGTSSVAAARALVEARSPRDAEGVVVRLRQKSCGAYHRVKLKSLAYAAAHGLSGDAASSPRNLLRIILTDRWDDVRVTVKPHLRDHGDALASGLAAWLVRIDDEFKRIMQATAGLDNARREFALAVQAAKLPIAPMISIWTAKVDTARGWVDQQRRADGEWGDAFLDNLAAWVGVKPVDTAP